MRQALDLLRDDREAAPCIAGAGGLDRCVQREQVGLPGNVTDQGQDRFDRFRVIAERLAHPHRLIRLGRRTGCDLCRHLHLTAGLIDGPDQSRRRRGCIAHRQRRLLRRGRHFGASADHRAGGLRSRGGLRPHPLAERRGPVDRVGDMLPERLGTRSALLRHALAIGSRQMRHHHVSLDQREALHHIGQPPHPRNVTRDARFDHRKSTGMGERKGRGQRCNGDPRLTGNLGMPNGGTLPRLIEWRFVFHPHVARTACHLPFPPSRLDGRGHTARGLQRKVMAPECLRDR